MSKVKTKAKPKQDFRAPDLSRRIAELRSERDLTLKELQLLTGIPASTLSKVQNQKATLSYEQIVQLASGLGIDVSEVFMEKSVDIKTGRRAYTPRDQGVREATDRYNFELLCSELTRKAMNPGIMEITARSLDEAGGLSHHPGEEFIYVLTGTVIIHTEDYSPLTLAEGDSMYLDSTSGHSYVNGGEGPCRILAVTTQYTQGERR